jgi:hypothetical protein
MVVRPHECGLYETAFNRIHLMFIEKSQFIRDFSFGQIDRLLAENSDFRATPMFGPHAVRIDGSGANHFSVVRVSECGSNETAFTEIQFDFMEKSRFIRDFSSAKNPKPENGKLRLFVGKWTAAASLGAMEAAA